MDVTFPHKDEISRQLDEAAKLPSYDDMIDADIADKAAGISRIKGTAYMTDAKGRLVPVESVKPVDLLMDQMVRKIIGYAEPLAAQVARFRQHSFDDVDALTSLIAEEYKVKLGGNKGNITLTSVDGLMQIKVQIADHITFGPELQAAKGLIDECLREWSEGSNANLRYFIEKAFDVDKEGKINQGELLSLRRHNVNDDRWKRAMQAIDDSIRIVGSKRYIRAYRRSDLNAPFKPIVIDVAAS